MASVASRGAAARTAARTLLKVLRAGSGTPARYSSMFFGIESAFFIWALLPRKSSVVDCLVSRGPEICAEIDPGRIQRSLGHQYTGHVLRRVRIAGSAKAAVPAEPSGHRRHLVALGDDSHAETPASGIKEAGKEAGHRLLVGGELVGGHQLDGQPREDAIAAA